MSDFDDLRRAVSNLRELLARSPHDVDLRRDLADAERDLRAARFRADVQDDADG